MYEPRIWPAVWCALVLGCGHKDDSAPQLHTRTRLGSLSDVGAEQASTRVPAGAVQRYQFVSTAGASEPLEVRGDGDTDLDCWFYVGGLLVSSDTDQVSNCVLTEQSAAGDTVTLVIRNPGSVYSDAVIRFGPGRRPLR